MSRAIAMAIAFAAAPLYFYSASCERFPTGTIEGTARDRFGAPIANVGVGVVGLAHSGLSDASGRYRLARVPVGTHRLRATVVGYAPGERDSVVVRKGVATQVDFALDRMWPGIGLPSTPRPDRATILANGAAIGWRLKTGRQSGAKSPPRSSPSGGRGWISPAAGIGTEGDTSHG